jgi:translation initiation factor IF-1
LGATEVTSHRKGREFIACISGRLRRFHVKVIPGDHITIAVSLHDPTHGLIVHRR